MASKAIFSEVVPTILQLPRPAFPSLRRFIVTDAE